MTTVGAQVEKVAKEFLGPAAAVFLRRELSAIGVTAETLRAPHVPALVARAERAAARLMEADRARDFVAALAACAGPAVPAEVDASAPVRGATSRAAPETPGGHVGEKVEQVAKQFLGPAAGIFLRRELTALGIGLDTMREAHVPALVARAERSASRLMEPDRAREFIRALTGCAGPAAAPEADTFRAVARDAISRDDIGSAVTALRDGAATLSRSNDRAGALALLEQAVRVAPGDLTAHRRFAAALVNRGDVRGACAEYARFVDLAVTRGDTRRAWLELTYAREMFGELPELLAIADRLLPAAVASAPAAQATPPPVSRDEELVPVAAGVRAGPRAAVAAGTDVVAAARHLLGDGKVGAASDLLLDHIARGSTDREAQRLLIEIGCALGRRDIAKEKCRALGTAYMLDGRPDAAGDLERLAAML
ncbi:MAG TPA: hypothetical protein VFW12_08655 [Candidatus Limnocylindria bacterium]|nr:hypothetical protein [Candidatus Limnocylindria bacterium]